MQSVDTQTALSFALLEQYRTEVGIQTHTNKQDIAATQTENIEKVIASTMI